MGKTLLAKHSLKHFTTLTHFENALEDYDLCLRLQLLEQANHNTIKENKNYKIKFTKRYWDNYRIGEEIFKCDVAGGLYDIGQGVPQFVSYDIAIEMCQELKPYDIVLEIEYEGEE